MFLSVILTFKRLFYRRVSFITFNLKEVIKALIVTFTQYFVSISIFIMTILIRFFFPISVFRYILYLKI